MTDELDKPIGTKEAQKLSAGSVIVREVTIDVPKEGSKAKLVNFHCKHADREELIKLANVMTKKTQGNNISIKKEATWYNLDDEGNIRKGGIVASLMTFYNKKSLREFVGSPINTELDTQGYLCIKAY